MVLLAERSRVTFWLGEIWFRRRSKFPAAFESYRLWSVRKPGPVTPWIIHGSSTWLRYITFLLPVPAIDCQVNKSGNILWSWVEKKKESRQLCNHAFMAINCRGQQQKKTGGNAPAIVESIRSMTAIHRRLRRDVADGNGVRPAATGNDGRWIVAAVVEP